MSNLKGQAIDEGPNTPGTWKTRKPGQEDSNEVPIGSTVLMIAVTVAVLIIAVISVFPKPQAFVTSRPVHLALCPAGPQSHGLVLLRSRHGVFYSISRTQLRHAGLAPGRYAATYVIRMGSSREIKTIKRIPDPARTASFC